MEQKITIPEGYELQKVNDSEYRIVKKKAELPNSWEEFCNTHPIKDGESWIRRTSEIITEDESMNRDKDSDKNIIPNAEYAKAILALCQLIQLRDCYRQGWKPDWTINNVKYVINFGYERLQCNGAINSHHILSFQSSEIRDKFYNNFKYLIEKTKPLFM